MTTAEACGTHGSLPKVEMSRSRPSVVDGDVGVVQYRCHLADPLDHARPLLADVPAHADPVHRHRAAAVAQADQEAGMRCRAAGR
ncbi:MAG: hypothetical protein VW405_13890 [Rhodospirillaceae bacterium]